MSHDIVKNISLKKSFSAKSFLLYTSEPRLKESNAKIPVNNLCIGEALT